MRDPIARPPSGERFGQFCIHERLGTGGMATVHRATFDIGMGVRRELAIKRLLPHLNADPAFVKDFVREAKLVVQLDHPNIVKVFELGRVGRTYFITMELVRGWSLEALMCRAHDTGARVPVAVALALLTELCDALDHASSATDDRGEPLRIVHRDISPSNLIVTDGGHVKMIDFGIATARAKFATDPGLVKGKLAYMAPEARSNPGSVDTRADIFSAGVVAWELLAGRRLCRERWDGAPAVIDPPSSVEPTCPRELDRVVLAALAATRERRWRSAAMLRDALVTIQRSRRALAAPSDVVRWARELAAQPLRVAEAAPTLSRIPTRSAHRTRRETPGMGWRAVAGGMS
jgi:serine/threonine-protein kinase